MLGAWTLLTPDDGLFAYAEGKMIIQTCSVKLFQFHKMQIVFKMAI